MKTKHRFWQQTVFCFALVLSILTTAEVQGAAAVLESIAISGPSSVATASTASYTCTATWDNGATSQVSPTWSVTTNYASVDTAGKVTNKNTTTSDMAVTLRASYTLDGTTKIASKIITMEKKTLTGITINGADTIPYGGTATYNCTATWSYGPSSTLRSAIWTLTGTAYASVDGNGVVTNNNTETTNKTVLLNARYISDGVTARDAKSITLEGAPVIPTQTLALEPGWNWVSFHVLPQSRKVGDTLGTAGFKANDLIQMNGDSARFTGNGWVSDDFMLEFGKLYQIYVASAVTVEFSGEASNLSSLPLASGWNWIGNPTAETLTVSQLVHSGGWTAGDRIQTNGNMATYSGSTWIPTGFSLASGKGCQIYAAKAGTLTFTPAVADDTLYAIVDLSGGPNAASYPVRYSATGPDLSDDTCRTTELWLRKIPKGTFIMGSPKGEWGRYIFERQHEVTLTQDYYMGVFECTQKQWELVMGGDSSNSSDNDTHPEELVSYYRIRGSSATGGDGWPTYGHTVDSTSFMGKLQAKTGLIFDLPTEAQWEYACRAGTTTALNSGKDLTTDWEEDPAMNEVGRYAYNGGIEEVSPAGMAAYGSAKVGSYLPNAWGLYDMHGNVSEWCLDWWDEDYWIDYYMEMEYGEREEDEWHRTDPVGPDSGIDHMIRGGSYIGYAELCRSASRSKMGAWSGFRVVCYPASEPEPDPELYAIVDLSSGSNAENYPVRYSATGPDLSDDTCRSTELWLRKIPKGTFNMGAPEDEVGRYQTDMTKHQVTLTQDYYIGVFECTQKQWELVMGRNPSMYTGDTRPVEQISYDAIRGADTTAVGWPIYGHVVDATSFMGILQAKTGLAFDLPTETQWEYACRAGTTSALNSGKDLTSTDVDANMTEVGRYYGNMYDGIGGYGPSTKVGCYMPNAWGLYDMHGNVAEWCLDWYGDSTSTASEEDPIGPATGSERVMRGGSWNNPAKDCRSAARFANSPSAFLNQIGFRITFIPPEKDLYVVVDLSGGPDATSYPIRYTNTAPDLSDDKCRTTELWLRKISAGIFMMGSPEFEFGRGDDEGHHQVGLTYDYYIGVFECTQRQWELVMGDRPSYFSNADYYATRPVEQVSYDMIRGTSETAGAGWPAYGHTVDSTSFMGVLQRKTGLIFDLPTEAQWENACRAGTTTSLNSGENISDEASDPAMDKLGRYLLARSDEMQDYTTDHGTAKVGSYLPNAWGLYDMHGNVAEWCLDWHRDYGGYESDPVGPTTGARRTIRGGYWYSNARSCRSASRSHCSPSLYEICYGFRVACHLNPGNYVVVDLSGGTTARSYPVRYTDAKPNVNDDTCRTTELWLRRIPKGTFMMGSPEDELGHSSDEELHEVTLTQDFYIGVFEFTQKQWELVAGSNPSDFKGDCRPVENVSYDIIRGTSATGGAGWPEYGYVVDMNSFLGILRNKTGLTFDLPMEAQWEYACRAGTTTAFNSGKNLISLDDKDANMAEVGRYIFNRNDEKGGYVEHTKVGSYRPNAWGLYDMHGNVNEWCLDRQGNTSRAIRGGNWYESAQNCRSANINSSMSEGSDGGYGFRIILLP